MNNNIHKKLKEEMDELVKYGEEIAVLASRSGSNLGQDYVTKTSTWVTKIGQIIRNLCPEGSQYGKNYEDIVKKKDFSVMHSNYYQHICVMNGIIKAIKDDYEKGLSVKIKQLLQADIFADFLEMGEYLLKENYKDAAAVIIGSVLEDALRKLAVKEGIDILREDANYKTLEPLNMELAKANVYDRLIQKQITSWGDLRNKAAHGHYNEYDKHQVEMMLLFVQKFCSDYLK